MKIGLQTLFSTGRTDDWSVVGSHLVMVRPGGGSIPALLVERDDDLLLDSEGYQEDG